MCLAIPGEVIAAYDRDGVRYADVRFGGIARQVCVHAVSDVEVGEFVLVHVGFAIAKMDRASAERALQLLSELNDELEKADE
ncbi:MAG TPA: HypC/HybG/HupF family hydrogenase formation chaperone [Labilithrix sp.]|nr:HypC/HybG/HupF family hydrogenase formation chaperone [Labilithrix sp.]